MSEPKQRVLFLYLATGGGHVGAARALMNSIREQYDDTVELHMLDGIPGGRTLARELIETGYSLASTTLPFIWPAIYELSKFPFAMHLQTESMVRHTSKHIAQYIIEHQITKVVNLHFLLIRPLRHALRLAGLPRLPSLTIITDPFTCHPLWTYRLQTMAVVFSEKAAAHCRRRLLGQGQSSPAIRISAPIINPKFDNLLSPEAIRQHKIDLGFDPTKPLVLMAGGGEGLPQGEQFLQALCRVGIDIEVAIVCGRNQPQYVVCRQVARLFGRLIDDEHPLLLPLGRKPRIAVKVLGFVTNMYELMNMADVVVTKAGPATMFEVLKLRKPLVITRFLYGQEQGNVDYVVRNRLGYFAPTNRKLVDRVRRLLAHPEQRARMAQRLGRLAIGNGTPAIAKLIVEELGA